jgi:signal transduction histidine kinase
MAPGPVRRLLASVRFRITAVATVAVAAALVVGAFGLVFLLQAGVVRTIRGDAQLRAAEVAALAQRGPLPAVLPPLTASRLTLVQVVGADGRVLAASAPLSGRLPLVAPREVSRHGDIQHLDGLEDLEGPWLVQVQPVTLDGRPAHVVVATSLADLRRSVKVLGKLLVGGLVVLVALVAGLCWVVVGRALRPIEAMRAEVDAITARALDRRVPEPPSGDEVGRLARTMNEMLDRLERASAAQRRFGEDASHELRTPVANIRTAIEVALAHPEHADWEALALDVLVQDERAQQLIDELLVLARTDGGRLERAVRPVDLAEAARAGAAPDPKAGAGVAVRTVLPEPVVVLADPTHVARIVANLIENARRFARSTVTIAVQRVGAVAVLAVEDDGPGVAEADRERVFERFVRLDQHRDRATGGSGLGLAIVRELVDAAGGTVAFEGPSPTSRVVVRLPVADLSALPQAPERTMAT